MCITPALQVKDGAEMGSLALTIHSVQLLSINFIEVLSQKKKKRKKSWRRGKILDFDMDSTHGLTCMWTCMYIGGKHETLPSLPKTLTRMFLAFKKENLVFSFSIVKDLEYS